MNLSNLPIPKIKIPTRVIAFIVALIGAAFIYWTMEVRVPAIDAETSKLNNEIASLVQTESNLNKLYQNMEFYGAETLRLNAETEGILSVFPSFMHLEDKILYADKMMATDLFEYNVTKMSYGASSYKMSVSYNQESNATLDLYSIAMNGAYADLSYAKIKELIAYGVQAEQRFVLDSITINFDEKTGKLSGQFSFTTYFIPGQETPYEFPQDILDSLGSGDRVGNLFG